jgi:hypothetical protein
MVVESSIRNLIQTYKGGVNVAKLFDSTGEFLPL